MDILIIEDDTDVRNLMKLMLERDDVTVHTAADGQEALSILKAGNINFDVLITDYNMPRMNGDELVKEVFKQNIPLKKSSLCQGYLITRKKWRTLLKSTRISLFYSNQ